MAEFLRIVLGGGDGGGRPAPDRARGSRSGGRRPVERVAGRHGPADGNR